ncbi:hypothetical protein NYQ10_08585 [Flavobacterium johnsoniae]|uniref:hypothetical protein n=1 Tax=Flavobacterium johnsoniae TaxID=986 RepID=UPI0025B05B33|nr:hypothetical protein [Flavobacterium johnsoniae]WJS96505.1 hypothetical protein NYQ10_08585 [Flavobacterium johnsoniae]
MRTLFIFTFIMIASFAKSQNLKCVDFKTGTFKIECTNYKLPITTLTRTEKIQKESNADLKDLEGTIKWISECNYELIYLNASPEMNGKKVSVEIIKIEGKKAICKSTLESLPDIVLNFEMEKL